METTKRINHARLNRLTTDVYGKDDGLSPVQTPISIKPTIDLFKHELDGTWATGTFIGNPFRISYSSIEILLTDSSKHLAGGIPKGSFLLAYYDNKEMDTTNEAILLRVIGPTPLPQEQDLVSSLIECFRDNVKSQLDPVTRFHYSIGGLKCSILGCFYKNEEGKINFGADLENFYSAQHYSIIKPSQEVLQFIVNYKGNKSANNNASEIKIGTVRYSSSQRIKTNVPVLVKPQDFAGMRTALFGMTRTGKSNTIKKIIQAIVEISALAEYSLKDEVPNNKFDEKGNPIYPIGQIIFDINGEYANANAQDHGTSIFTIYEKETIRYSILEKKGFEVMRINFYNDIEDGFELIKEFPDIANDDARFVDDFRKISLNKPTSYDLNPSIKKRHDRKIAVYKCCLYKAGFLAPENYTVDFCVNKQIRTLVDLNMDASDQYGNITLKIEEAINWWTKFWEKCLSKTSNIQESNDDSEDNEDNNKDWADDELKALLAILTGKTPQNRDCHGYKILKGLTPQHSHLVEKPFRETILSNLRVGKIVIIDLSSGNEVLQNLFCKRITTYIFNDSMKRFTENKPHNFIQFYFEEAHNLFPKKDDSDLTQIYNRLAKEGAKLNLGLIYATQEVSSISSNILKNTQNWFISHLNNHEEIKDLTKYYDFCDFTDELIKFSEDTDKGFVRMKTYSNAFVVPVQIDEFKPDKNTSNK